MIRLREELVDIEDMWDQCTVSVWHTDTMLDKVCNSAGTLSAHQHKDMSDMQDIFYFYIGRIDSLMGIEPIER